MHVEGPVRARPAAAPHLGDDPPARAHRAARRREQREDLELLAGERDRLPGDRDLVAAQVHAHVGHRHGVAPVAGRERGGASPQHGVHPGQQLTGVEGLHQVVVGPAVQALDAVVHLAPRRHDDHRDVAGGPDLAADVDAVHVRQAQVEQHDVHPGQVLGDAAAAREPGGGHAVPVQGGTQRGGHPVVVLDQQDVHPSSLPRSASGMCPAGRTAGVLSDGNLIRCSRCWTVLSDSP